jgi:hypothetical protein
MKPHKWAKEIKAWADGAEIEFKTGNAWWDAGDPEWNEDAEYRIKPQLKGPQYLYVYGNDGEIKYMYSEPRKWVGNFLGKIRLEVDDE